MIFCFHCLGCIPFYVESTENAFQSEIFIKNTKKKWNYEMRLLYGTEFLTTKNHIIELKLEFFTSSIAPFWMSIFRFKIFVCRVLSVIIKIKKVLWSIFRIEWSSRMMRNFVMFSLIFTMIKMSHFLFKISWYGEQETYVNIGKKVEYNWNENRKIYYTST